jgi:hypothetical protein
MAQLLIPEIDDDVMERLGRRARRHDRSIEAEARAILEASADEAGFEESAGEGLPPLTGHEQMGLGDLMFEHFKDRGLTDEEFARFNTGIAEINSRSQMRIPDFEAEDFEEGPSDK